ncbi:hypothetical protein [Colwellia ponticola]|uniref:Uncharacterized protein n=1 Tax=Colwellia ponticola TaxID=2304625 RepID=A0A8H2PKZ5_9GAMM|nr:hypothetical protein [Colwellia ponticola]TMM43245.1 hypothetical protein FCS21_12745 [Colwellia ponticola]
MHVFKYKPYYHYDGPTRSDPFREELSSEEANDHVESFFSDIERFFAEGSASFKQEDELIVITTDINETNCDEIVKKCLNSLDLFAHKVRN